MASEITQRQRAEAALNINDRVRVSGTRYVRVIESFLPDVDGGVKLNKPVNGFLCWNVRDLRRLDRLAREEGEGAYWWRPELRRRAALTPEQIEQVEAALTPQAGKGGGA